MIRSQCRGVLMVIAIAANAAVAQAGEPPPGEARWAFAPYACDGELETREETPLIFAEGEIRWFNLACRVVSSYKVKDTVFLQARCASEGKTSTIPIMLAPIGERLRLGWNREPVREMQRCRWVDGFGYR